jgi:hypothetical protein
MLDLKSIDDIQLIVDVPEFVCLVRNVEMLAKHVHFQITPTPKTNGIISSVAVFWVIDWAFTACLQLLLIDIDAQNWRRSFSRLGPPSRSEKDFLISEYHA